MLHKLPPQDLTQAEAAGNALEVGDGRRQLQQGEDGAVAAAEVQPELTPTLSLE